MENNIYQDLKDNLNNIVTLLETNANKPAVKTEILDRELSGNKINGGKITNFSSVGIRDIADSTILEVSNKGIRVRKAEIHEITSPVSINGDVRIEGEIFAKKLQVDELNANIKLERSTPLAFVANNNSLHGLGIIWTGLDYTKQFIYQDNNKFFSTENIDLYRGKAYKIDDIPVLTQHALGTTVKESNITKLGTVQNLKTSGTFTVDNYIFYQSSSNRIGIGTDVPNGSLSIKNDQHEFIITDSDEREFSLGTFTTSNINFITDNKSRIKINYNGVVTFETKTVFNNKIGIGVENFIEDVDITTAGPVRLQNKKFEVADKIPVAGNYIKGDIIWNSEPKPTGYVGWICVRTGAPGEWKAFGNIQQ